MIWRVVAGAVLASGLSAPVAAQSLPFQDDFYAGLLLGGFSGTDTGIHQGGTGGSYDFAMHPRGGAIGIVGGAILPLVFVSVGVEADASIVIGATDRALRPAAGSADAVAVNALGHVRGRVGAPIGPFTPFLAGGLAAASVDRSYRAAGGATATNRYVMTGFSLGGGVDFAVTNQATLRLEAIDDIFSTHQSAWVPSLTDYSSARLTLPSVRAALTLDF